MDISVQIQFNFNNKEEWLEFGQKLCSQKQFEKHFTGIFKGTVKDYGSFENAYNNCINIPMNCPVITMFPQLYTSSRKVLESLNKWIKKNHYENNYELHRFRHHFSEQLDMNLDEVLNRWENVIDTNIVWIITDDTDKKYYDSLVYENNEIQIVAVKEDPPYFNSPMIVIFSDYETINLGTDDKKWISELKECLTDYNITTEDQNKIIESAETFWGIDKNLTEYM